MSRPVIAFFNNKGGVGKTSLVFHLAWMYSKLGERVIAADLDPQANLTAAFLEEEQIEELWEESGSPKTIFACLQPILRGTGDVLAPELILLDDSLALLPGDLDLSKFEDELSQEWLRCLDGNERAFRVVTAFWRILQFAAHAHGAKLILVDLGPNLGSINRAALVAADFVVVPLGPDLFSLRGLRNLGPTFRRWRNEWEGRLKKKPASLAPVPSGAMKPLGYVIQQHSVRLDRPVKAYERWIARIPAEYRQHVLDQPEGSNVSINDDHHKLALLKHYRSLMPMAQEARKPMFDLKPADGAIGAHMESAQQAYRDFKALAREIAARAEIELSSSIE